VVSPDEINLGGETKITFDDPFYAEANTSYAVVLLTNSTNYRVRIATLGQMGQNGVITRQTYAEGVLLESSNAETWTAQGVLLESSNAETWTPLNGSDLTVKIYGYDFQPSGEVRFQPVTGAQFSELNLDEYSAIPEGTGIVWEYSADGGTTWDAIVPAEEENLPNIASDVLLRALFESTAVNDSPALNYKDVNLIGHLNNTTGTYISRENELTQGVESTKVYTQMNIPSGLGAHVHRVDAGDRPRMDRVHTHPDLLRSERDRGSLQSGNDRQQPGLPADSHPRGHLELMEECP